MHLNTSLRTQFSAALLRAGRAWRRRVDEAVRALGLSESKAWALINIHRLGDGVRQITVADAIGIEGPSLVRLLDQLCTAEWVERREDAHDRRAKTLHLTPQGRALVEQVEALLHDVRGDILAGISQAELATCLRVFQIIESDVHEPAGVSP